MTDPSTASPSADPSEGERALVERLLSSVRNEEQTTLVLGSGVCATVIRRVTGILKLADQYAAGRSDDGGLRSALLQAREEAGDDRPIRAYAAYRRVFADWVSGNEFDVIAQQAVLDAYRPPDRMESPLATHGMWQRVDFQLGERVERDLLSWALPVGVQAVGALLASMPEAFGNQIVTTNFDPLVEISIRAANRPAVSLTIDQRSASAAGTGEDGAIRVIHPHGFWRPTDRSGRARLLNDPGAPTVDSDYLVERTARYLTGDTILVLGCSDWAGTLSKAIAAVAADRPVNVLWALHLDSEAEAQSAGSRIPTELQDSVQVFVGIDSNRLLPMLARDLNVAISPRPGHPRHSTRHHTWERQLVSQTHAVPPPDVAGLLVQLERRFGWTTHHARHEQPGILLWPVRLRPRASVIHMVQALVAGALASRGMQLVICLDDFGPQDPEARSRFVSDIERWIRHTGMAAAPSFVSLKGFIDGQRQQADRPPEETLLRPTDPWAVAQAFYGSHNPSLYSVLAAVKAVPNIATIEELERNAWNIVQALLSKDANRLLTPMTLWSCLQHLLLEHPSSKVVTLGGRDEALFWSQWREAFGLGVGQLYNPHIKSLSHKSEMLRWATAAELKRHLQRSIEIAGWDAEGSYIPWLFQNGLLLSIYLAQQQVLEVGDYPLDSWAAFMAAIEDGTPVLDLLADHVSGLYLGELSP